MSLVEAIDNVAVGYGVAVVTQILIFPVFGLHATLTQNLQMGAISPSSASPVASGSGGYSRRSGCEARESVVGGLIDCRATR
jgi:hypothetical protein